MIVRTTAGASKGAMKGEAEVHVDSVMPITLKIVNTFFKEEGETSSASGKNRTGES